MLCPCVQQICFLAARFFLKYSSSDILVRRNIQEPESIWPKVVALPKGREDRLLVVARFSVWVCDGLCAPPDCTEECSSSPVITFSCITNCAPIHSKPAICASSSWILVPPARLRKHWENRNIIVLHVSINCSSCYVSQAQVCTVFMSALYTVTPQ